MAKARRLQRRIKHFLRRRQHSTRRWHEEHEQPGGRRRAAANERRQELGRAAEDGASCSGVVKPEPLLPHFCCIAENSSQGGGAKLRSAVGKMSWDNLVGKWRMVKALKGEIMNNQYQYVRRMMCRGAAAKVLAEHAGG